MTAIFDNLQKGVAVVGAFFTHHFSNKTPMTVLPGDRHPLLQIFEAKTLDEYRAAKKSLKTLSEGLYQYYKVERKEIKSDFTDKLLRAREAVERVSKTIYGTSNKQNEISGSIYMLNKSDSNDLDWGRNHALDDTKKLIFALDMEGQLGREKKECLIWDNYEINQTLKSSTYSLERPLLNKGGIGYINGVYTPFHIAKNDANRLSVNLANGVNFSCIYNSSQGLAEDVALSLLLQGGICTPPVRLLLQQWMQFFATHDSSENFLQICFSQGVCHVSNALDLLDPKLRQRIHVIAIAPAVYIPKMEGCQVKHFTKLEDPVRYVAKDRTRMDEHDPDIIVVPADTCNPHDPHGPEFVKAIAPFVQKYIEENKIA